MTPVIFALIDGFEIGAPVTCDDCAEIYRAVRAELPADVGLSVVLRDKGTRVEVTLDSAAGRVNRSIMVQT